MAKAARLKNRHAKMRGKPANRWAKGHSSDSNPATRKFRDMAASSRFLINNNNNNDNGQETKLPKRARKIRFKLDVIDDFWLCT